METTFSILLPFCVQTQTDVFLEILRNSVKRSGISEFHDLVSALKSGMSEIFSIESEDVTVDWTKLDSKTQQIRQWKLIGFWTLNNFPSMVEKLIGESCGVPKRNAIQVNGNSAFEADSIDEFIYLKMKPRIIELTVAESTRRKLKHFTLVPDGIRKSKEQRVSRKMKSFEVDAEFVECCWNALKSGKFSMNSDFEVSYPAFSFQCLNNLKS